MQVMEVSYGTSVNESILGDHLIENNNYDFDMAMDLPPLTPVSVVIKEEPQNIDMEYEYEEPTDQDKFVAAAARLQMNLQNHQNSQEMIDFISSEQILMSARTESQEQDIKFDPNRSTDPYATTSYIDEPYHPTDFQQPKSNRKSSKKQTKGAPKISKEKTLFCCSYCPKLFLTKRQVHSHQKTHIALIVEPKPKTTARKKTTSKQNPEPKGNKINPKKTASKSTKKVTSDPKPGRRSIASAPVLASQPTTTSFACPACSNKFSCELGLEIHECAASVQYKKNLSNFVQVPSSERSSRTSKKSKTDDIFDVSKLESLASSRRVPARCDSDSGREDAPMSDHEEDPNYNDYESLDQGEDEVHIPLKRKPRVRSLNGELKPPRPSKAKSERKARELSTSSKPGQKSANPRKRKKNENPGEEMTFREKVASGLRTFPKCTHCDERFARTEYREPHMKFSHPEVQPHLTCDICAATFYHHAGLHMHKISFHSSPRAISCDHCEEKFRRPGHREAHMRSAHPEIEPTLLCDECPSKFYHMKALRMHKTNHTLGKTHSCKYCNKKYPTKVRLYTHEMFHHVGSSTHPCDNCDKVFPTKIQLERHIHLRCHFKDQKRNFKCPFCPAVIEKYHEFSTHVESHKRGIEGTLTCTFEGCGKSFANDNALKCHERRHVKLFQCDECGAAFRDKFRLSEHTNVHTGERPFACDYENCDKKFRRKDDLRAHKRCIHELKKPFVCEICGRAWAKKWFLESHMLRAHDNSEPQFLCTLCGEKFKEKRSMDRHIKLYHPDGVSTRKRGTHFQSKDFPCPNCTKKFVSEEAVTHHVQRMHLERNKLPFTCSYCGKGFQRQYAVSVHERIHTGEKPFVCPICNQFFISKETLAIHNKKHHDS